MRAADALSYARLGSEMEGGDISEQLKELIWQLKRIQGAGAAWPNEKSFKGQVADLHDIIVELRLMQGTAGGIHDVVEELSSMKRDLVEELQSLKTTLEKIEHHTFAPYVVLWGIAGFGLLAMAFDAFRWLVHR